MRILVTGAAGFIGAAVARQACLEGHEVIAVVRPGSDDRRIKLLRSVTVMPVDLRDQNAMVDVIRNAAAEVIVHCAWAGVNQKFRADSLQIADNVESSCRLIEAAARYGASKFVGLGSQAEYGALEGRITETALPRPTTLYGASKLATYVLTSQLASQLEIEFAWMRVFSAYGPDDNPHWLIPSTIEQMLRGERPRLTAGRQYWDFLFIDDLAKAILEVARQSNARGLFNLGSGSSVQICAIVEKIRNIASPKMELVFGEVPYRSDQIWHMEADITKLQRSTGWQPKISIEEGLAATISWHRHSRPALGG